MPSFKQYSGLKYASFSVWWICDRQLTHLMEKRNNPCWIFSFSYPSAPLTHKYALRTFPQLYSLPLEWQKNRGAAVPTNIRMQTRSTGLAAILHLKAPWYSLLSWQIKKKWYRAIWCPFNAISRFKWHFTFNTSLKHIASSSCWWYNIHSVPPTVLPETWWKVGASPELAASRQSQQPAQLLELDVKPVPWCTAAGVRVAEGKGREHPGPNREQTGSQ